MFGHQPIAKNMQYLHQVSSSFFLVLSGIHRIRFIVLLFFGTAIHISAGAQVLPVIPQTMPVIPQPVMVAAAEGTFTIHKGLPIVASVSDTSISSFLNEAIFSHTGYHLKIAKKIKGPAIRLSVDGRVQQKEGYELEVDRNGIAVRGHDAAGLFYGLQSLIQLFQLKEASRNISVQNGLIRDYPRFGYRGMHIDVGRHLFSVDFLKKFIDLLALYKLNTFHWHLTEDQGWRIEIKKYPRLQSVAAFRNGTIIGHKKETPHTFDGQRYGGYYTQEQIAEVVAYAGRRHINIIPEIEMPGHALAALSAYPELGCTGGPYQAAQFWGVFDDVFCAGNDQVYEFMEGVLDEVIRLFPYQYIHIGGDECPKLKWKSCPKCQKRIQENGLKDEHGLQGYFMRRIVAYLESKNRKAIGWDEVLEGGVSKETTIMNWRGEETGVAAAKEGYDVIMTPERFLYLDYYQSLHPEEPVAAASYTPLSKVYGYEPLSSQLNAAEAAHIKGVQAGLWSEYMDTPEQLEYMAFPRMLALSELAWSAKEQKNFTGFLARLRAQEPLLKRLNVNYFPYFDEVMGIVRQQKGNVVQLELSSTLPSASIRYTLDGKDPDKNSTLYDSAIVFGPTALVKARLFHDGQPLGRIFTQAYQAHLAVQKNIKLNDSAAGTAGIDPGLLLNGIMGTHRFNEGQWLGLRGRPLDVTIDLGAVHQVNRLGTNILNYHWQRMWAPSKLRFYVSADGVEFKEVYTQNTFPVNGINKVRATIPLSQVRYVRMFAEVIDKIPVGEYGEGAAPLLMVDEIYVN
ncbi:beta-hexosaminidase precursor [Pedobacter sp. BAL39]|nr:beta-hexosaminidase precursor [Pedobacter sp. BAL39]